MKKKKTQNSLPDCDFEYPEYRARVQGNSSNGTIQVWQQCENTSWVNIGSHYYHEMLVQ